MSSPTPYVASITVDTVITALGAFVQPFMPEGAQCIRAQVNRVAYPPAPFALFTELLQVDLETPSITVDDIDAQIDIYTPTRIDIQIDFYGEFAGDYCKAVKNVFRTYYATSQFPNGIKPLYCSDARQSPLITGEEQYLSRWTLTATLQYNPVVAVPQQFADELAINILEDLP